MPTFYVYLILVLCGTVSSLKNECVFHNSLPRDVDRYSNNSVTPSRDKAACDNVASGWYRFHSGEIVTSCVPTGHCGTMNTVWMNDTIPTVGQTKECTFCVHHDAADNCCLYSFKENVTNCDGLLVYYFRRRDLLCPSGYCTELLKRCPSGSQSLTGFEPCSNPYPHTSPPTIGNPTLTPDGHDFSQTCAVGYQGSDKNVSFEVTLLFNGKPSLTVTLIGGLKAHDISSSTWVGHVGETLTCSVRAFYEGNENNKSPPLISNEYFGGITLTPKQVSVHEGQEVNLDLTSTLPIICDQRVPQNICKMDLEMMVAGGNPDDIHSVGGCSSWIWERNWNPTTGKTSNTVKLTTVVDRQNKADMVYTVAFRTMDDSLGHKMWNNYTVNGTTVTVRDAGVRTCTTPALPRVIIGRRNGSTRGFTYVDTGENTPWFTRMPIQMNMRFPNSTFSKTYEVPDDEVVDMQIFRSTDYSGKVFQVQARTHGKTGQLCGVALQHGDTMALLNTCTSGSSKRSESSRVAQVKQGQEEVHVYHCGSRYEFVTSTAQASFDPQDRGGDIRLHVPSLFAEDYTGVADCNVRPQSDSGLHSDSYRVLKGGSLFEMRTQDDDAPAAPTAPVWYCKCGGQNALCHQSATVRQAKLGSECRSVESTRA